MKRKTLAFLLISLILCLGGCQSEKSADLSIIYICTSVISVLLLLGYCTLIKQRNKWFLLLFISVCVVNCGYLMLACSKTLPHALWANRLSYFGSVFLPFSILMVILDVCHFQYGKKLSGSLLVLSIAVFFVAASPGYLDIYYRSVSLEFVNGTAVLVKEYGAWHLLYFVYLLGYFSAMVSLVLYASMRKLSSVLHAMLLSGAVLVNIGVWLLEQFIKIDVEFLSVSYIVSELFLLMLFSLLERLERPSEDKKPQATALAPDADAVAFFVQNIATLTPTEHTIYELYLSGMATKDVLVELNIKENTLKYHNKNIYSKLGVSSRKQLICIGRSLKSDMNV